MMTKQRFNNNDQIRQESDRKFLRMTILTLVLVGGGLIGLIYGLAAILTALPILLLGVGLILLPWWVLNWLEKWRRRLDDL